MTKIILLMWLADVAGSISIVGVVCLFAVVLGLGCAVFCAFMSGDDMDWTPQAMKRVWPIAKWPALIVLVAVFTPNPSTLRLAAAGVAVGEVAKTATAQKAVEAFNVALDEIISKTRGKK